MALEGGISVCIDVFRGKKQHCVERTIIFVKERERKTGGDRRRMCLLYGYMHRLSVKEYPRNLVTSCVCGEGMRVGVEGMLTT